MRYTLQNLLVTLIMLLLIEHSYARNYEIHAYRSYAKPKMEKMILIGQVSARTKVTGSSRRKVLDYDTRDMVLTARLYDHENLRLGDTIFIIEKDPQHKKYKNGYVVAEATIYSIFKTEFQGWMLKANGNFSMVKKGHFIARKDNAQAHHEALVLLKQGDKHRAMGNTALALKNYSESLQKDSNRPETYLQLARQNYKLGRKIIARKYLKNSFNKLNKFSDINAALLLPSLYMEWEIDYIDKGKDPQVKRSRGLRKWQLKRYLALLKDIRQYQKHLKWFKQSFRKDILSLLLTKGIPQYNYQYFKATLFERIYSILDEPYAFKRTSFRRVLEWLTPEERTILYGSISLPGLQKKFAYPKKEWEGAFFQAALYHYRLSHDELNHLDTRAAYRIVHLCMNKYKRTGSRVLKKDFAQWILHYGAEFLRVPGDNRKTTIVRNIINSVKSDQI